MAAAGPIRIERSDSRRAAGMPRRKPTELKRLLAGDISPILRREVERHVIDLLATQHQEEFSRTIARRLGMPERAVDLTMGALMAQYRSEAATLRVGVLGAVQEASETSGDVWRDR